MERERGMYWPSSHLHQDSLCVSNTQECAQVFIGRRTTCQGKVQGGALALAIIALQPYIGQVMSQSQPC